MLTLSGVVTFGDPFKRIVSFGDSLADTGTAHIYTGGFVPTEPGHFDGRFSNGIVWVEYLASDLRLPVDDYACGGARTNDQNFLDPATIPLGVELPGFTDEVDLFLADLGTSRVHQRDLIAVTMGSNDFFTYFTLVEVGLWPVMVDFPIGVMVGNEVDNIERLLNAGAQHVVVTNIPDLSKTPKFAAYPGFIKEWIRIMVGTYNLLLELELGLLADDYNCSIVVVDIESAMNHMVSNKELYGLENVTESLETNPALNPDTTLFWDDVHPTTYGHRLLANEVLDTILNAYVPGEAIGLDGNLPGWIHN